MPFGSPQRHPVEEAECADVQRLGSRLKPEQASACRSAKAVDAAILCALSKKLVVRHRSTSEAVQARADGKVLPREEP